MTASDRSTLRYTLRDVKLLTTVPSLFRQLMTLSCGPR